MQGLGWGLASCCSRAGTLDYGRGLLGCRTDRKKKFVLRFTFYCTVYCTLYVRTYDTVALYLCTRVPYIEYIY